jgi:DNA-binding PadR family transcriptional regulator
MQDQDMTSVDPTCLSLTDWIVLGLIAEQSRHGFAIASELAADAPVGRVWTVHRPLVYRAIDHLEALDLVEPTRTEDGKQGPKRTLFRATRRGRTMLVSWLKKPVEHQRDVRTELMVKFMLLDRRGEPLGPLAARQLERFGPLARAVQRSQSTGDSAERIVTLWRLESIRATNRMLKRVIEQEASAVARAKSAT